MRRNVLAIGRRGAAAAAAVTLACGAVAALVIEPAAEGRGQQDDGEYLEIDPDRLNATTSAAQTSTATVSINVG